MGVSSLRHSALFFLFLLFSSGSSVPKNPPLEATWRSKTQLNQENHMFFSSSVYTTQHDTIPVVNPSPTAGTPTPTYTMSPPTPTSTDPYSTPVPLPPTPMTPTPTMTSPTTPTPTTTTPTTPTPPTTHTPPATQTPPMTTPTTTPTSSGGSWCIAIQSASQNALQVALDYACGYGGADCSVINQGGSCYNPNTLQDHASYAFNDYYQKNPSPTSCNFGGTAQLTNTDPSTGSCRFSSSSASTSLNSPPGNPPPSTLTTPPTTPMTPTNPYTPSIATPGGSTIYGSEPTESPNSATSVSSCKLLLLTTTGLLGSLLAANFI